MTSRFKTTYLLLAVFVVLLAVVVVFENSGADRKRRKASQDKPILEAAQVDAVERLTMSFSSGEEVSLLQQDGQWTVGSGYTADQKAVEDFLETLRALPRGKKVSENEQNWQRYGLQEAAAFYLRGFQGEDQSFEIVFGNAGTRPQSRYVRWEGNPQVMLTSSGIMSYLSYTSSQWRFKGLFDVDQERIAALSLDLGDEQFAFRQSNGGWTVSDASGIEAIIEDTEMFTEYLSMMTSLQAADFAGEEVVFGEPEFSYQVVLEDGTEHLVEVDTQEESQHFARVSGFEEILRLNSDLRTQLSPSFIPEGAEAEASPETTES